jgi:hypothetical protein
MIRTPWLQDFRLCRLVSSHLLPLTFIQIADRLKLTELSRFYFKSGREQTIGLAMRLDGYKENIVLPIFIKIP